MSANDADDPTPPRDPVPDPVARPPHHTALHDILWFLGECRERGYRVGPYVEHAGTRIQVSDLRQAAREGYTAEHGPIGIFEEHGYKEPG